MEKEKSICEGCKHYLKKVVENSASHLGTVLMIFEVCLIYDTPYMEFHTIKSCTHFTPKEEKE